jgi:tRNA wybutosine-synthesizing protein 3
MTFENEKKTFLAKIDRSKKGSIDQKAILIIEAINQLDNYYTTSSCSGRVYLWRSTGKKSETEWINMNHDLIHSDFFNLKEKQGTIWLRFEGFILHVACRNLESATIFLVKAKSVFKKSSILSISNKIIVEVKSSEIIEMPFYCNGPLYSGDYTWLVEHINHRFENNWKKMELLKHSIKEKIDE